MTQAYARPQRRIEQRQDHQSDGRLWFVAVCLCLVAAAIVARLCYLMILHPLTESTKSYRQLTPDRGEVFLQDSRVVADLTDAEQTISEQEKRDEYPLAINREYFTIFADTRQIPNDDLAEDVAEQLAAFFDYDDVKKLELYYALNKRTDPYEIIEKKVEETKMEELMSKKLPGIVADRFTDRVYPEGTLASTVIGFLGKDEAGNEIGRYGIEGYWQETLFGKAGFSTGARSAKGNPIVLSDQEIDKEQNGADLLLTIDRTIQYYACERLRKGLIEYGATSASLIIMDPFTGAIRAMCSLPDFDPNTYNQVTDVRTYNNTTIFTPYEPGSIMKPLVMSMAINEGLVAPTTPFFDEGSAPDICEKPIFNADLKSYKQTDMTGVLVNSINTGMVYTGKLIGRERMREYYEKFGFGVKEGIELDTEVTGSIESLSRNKGNRYDCYAATASFGQGFTVTPLQAATAFSAIANGGKLMKPYVVDEVRYANGKIERTKPKEIREIISARSASLVAGMMVNVIDKGKIQSVKIPEYYMAGKSGTAQIAGQGGYSEDTNHSFVGFGPIEHPKFLILVKYEKPQRRFSYMTAEPTYSDIAKFLLQYYEVPPER